MTTVHLPETWISRLVRLPESGMGYQRVNITLKTGEVLRNVVVFNAEDCQAPRAFDAGDIIEIQLAN